MSEGINVAVVGATGLVGEALVQQLDERAFPVAQLFLLASDRSVGRSQLFRDKWVHVQDAAGFDFGQVKLVFLAVPAEVVEQYLPAIQAAGCRVVDLSRHARLDADVPLLVPELGIEDADAVAPRVVSPEPTAVMLALALAPLQREAGIESVRVCGSLAVSAEGRAGVEELAGQTAKLLGSQSFKPKVYAKQVTFNRLAAGGPVVAAGYTAEELQLVAELRRLLGEVDLQVLPALARVPVFFGHSLEVSVITREKIALEDAARLFRKAKGISLVDAAKGAGYATPVGDAVDKDAVLLSRLRQPLFESRELSFCLVADNMRKGSALNAVQLAENLRTP